MEYLLSCEGIRIVASSDRRDWKRRTAHPLEAEIRTAAGTYVPVLITAGKARAKAIAGQIHRRSGRSAEHLVVVDCSIAPHRYDEQILHSNGGDSASLVLLEVDHLPAAIQVRLRARLTVEARARAMGAPAPLLGGRLIATCSCNLYDAVVGGSFDRDLFYRLNTIHIVSS
jgi:two-component system, NtrC family, response regulator AtoC